MATLAYPHTLRVLARYDRMQPVLDQMLERACESMPAFVAWETAMHRELVLVQLAYRRDTYKINSLGGCLQCDIPFMRRTATGTKT